MWASHVKISVRALSSTESMLQGDSPSCKQSPLKRINTQPIRSPDLPVVSGNLKWRQVNPRYLRDRLVPTPVKGIPQFHLETFFYFSVAL